MIHTITVKNLLEHAPDAGCIIDIRSPEVYASGTIPGAVNLPVDEEEDGADLLAKVPQKAPLYILCHTGQRSREIAEDLVEEGVEAFSVEGGYRAFLAWKLRLEAAGISGTQGKNAGAEEGGNRRLKDIERSIIKKFRKQLWCRFTKAVTDYQLTREGDRIAVCISGGKDSMLMAKLMQEIHNHGKVKFDLVFLCMNPGYNEYNWQIIENNARILGIDLTVFRSDIFDAVAAIDKNPCYLCARMRRGYLYNHAKQLGCNKIALGHHYDDVIETILMGILFAGKTETMMPKLHSQNFGGMELIRPMYLIREESIKAWRDYNDLHFIQCACRFTESCSVQGGSVSSKRAYVKKLIAGMAVEDPVIEANIFNCVRDINLRTILGYHKDGKNYHFLDDYEKYADGIPEKADLI